MIPCSQVRDYQCGGRTYDGHDGTDIRVPDLEIQRGGVEVLASAPGRVVTIIRGTGKAAVALDALVRIYVKFDGNDRTSVRP